MFNRVPIRSILNTADKYFLLPKRKRMDRMKESRSSNYKTVSFI
jgi:predicted ABC-type exoprotein transport system permease subunit